MKYHLSVFLNGSFLFRTEPQSYFDFKISLFHLKHLLKDPAIKFNLHRTEEVHLTTYGTDITEANCHTILEGLSNDPQ